jgi:hypothetical protein
MAGQGSTIRGYAAQLRDADWTVVYTCIPNTPHVGVVAISIAGSSKQHYPDILAFKEDVTKIVEVEMQLTAAVAEKIRQRFEEIRGAFHAPGRWSTFRQHVKETTGIGLPKAFSSDCELVVCGNGKGADREIVTELARFKVRVVFVENSSS